ncbi:hypothetical protein [Citrobacter koseri]|uniref:hypothetical protein n=1 Tax=Citrobacter koseri TaxID=545 RepID=UPI003892C612
MALSSVAIVAGVATLAASLFKDTELRVKDIVELSKLSVNNIANEHRLKIVKNDVNAHITGIKDPAYHEVLIEIMAKHDKPVGYFTKVDGRLNYNHPYDISITKIGLKQYFKRVFKDPNNWVGTIAYTLVTITTLGLAVELDNDPQTFSQGISIFLSGMGGLMFSFLLKGLSVQWKNNFHNVKDSEYEKLFKEYAESKKGVSIPSNSNG